MQDFVLPRVFVIRHRKENLKKCSLRGLEQRCDVQFFSYPPSGAFPPFDNVTLLTLNAPSLTRADAFRTLLLLDGTWKYAEKMEKQVKQTQKCIKRSLPLGWVTAYPRRQEGCVDPERGLASVEALYAAYRVLGWDAKNLLDHYYWRDAFLTQNKEPIRLINGSTRCESKVFGWEKGSSSLLTPP